MEETDEMIAIRVQHGDLEAFGILVKRYEDRLIRYGTRFIGRREQITDTVQDIFVKAYMNLNSFRASERFSPWIYRIAHNMFVNEIRRNARHPLFSMSFDTDSLFPHPIAAETADKDTLTKEEVTAMEKHLAQLKPADREIIQLYYFEELSYDEISDILQIAKNAVGVKIHRAKERLRATYNHSPYDRTQ